MIIDQRECKYVAHDIHVEQIRMAICHAKTLVCMKKIKEKYLLIKLKSLQHMIDALSIYLTEAQLLQQQQQQQH